MERALDAAGWTRRSGGDTDERLKDGAAAIPGMCETTD